jgi:hypothetical protein
MQEGWSYEAIAQAENLSRERIRQIVKESLDERRVDPAKDHTRLQMARLDPALRLAAEKIAEGDLTAIDRLIRVLDRMDKYQSAGAAAEPPESEDDARERILRKLSEIDSRRQALADWSSPERLGETRGGLEEMDIDAEAEARKNDVAKFFRG